MRRYAIDCTQKKREGNLRSKNKNIVSEGNLNLKSRIRCTVLMIAVG